VQDAMRDLRRCLTAKR